MKTVLLLLLLIISCHSFSQWRTLPEKVIVARFSKGKWEVLNKETVIKSLDEAKQRYGDVAVMLEGYTDSIGTVQYNTYLADFRLKAVTQLMSELSVEVMKSKNQGERSAGKLEENRIVQITLFKRMPVIVEEVVEEIPEPVVEEEPVKIELNVPQILKIEFVGGTADIMPYSYSEVDKLFFVLLDFPDYAIELHGHVCCTDNYELSYARAQAVKTALMRKGIDAERIAIFGHSNQKPLVSENTEGDKQRNRRVEAVFKEL